MPQRSDEWGRLNALRSYEIMDGERNAAFDRIVRLAQTVMEVPIAKINFIDRHHAWTAAVIGADPGRKPRALTFCNQTIANDEPFIVEDATRDSRFATLPAFVGGPAYRFYAGVPIKDRDGYNLGALCCFDTRSRTPVSAQIAALQDLATLAYDAIELRMVATRDTLTGVLAKRALLDAGRRDLALAVRHGRPLSAMIIGIDDFDALHAKHGSSIGDTLLRRLASICKERLRSSDYIGQIGPGRFALMLRETFPRDCKTVADRLREALGREFFRVSGETEFQATASAGVAGLGPDTSTVEALLQAADDAFATAIRGGGRRTILHDRPKLRHG